MEEHSVSHFHFQMQSWHAWVIVLNPMIKRIYSSLRSYAYRKKYLKYSKKIIHTFNDSPPIWGIHEDGGAPCECPGQPPDIRWLD